MLNIPGLEQEAPSEFPCTYLQAQEWGWSVEETDELFKYFLSFNACHLPNPYNDFHYRRLLPGEGRRL